MGFFSKIKNYITGGAATVKLVFENRYLTGSDQTLRLFVTAVANADCKIKKVYLDIRGREYYEEKVTRTVSDEKGNVRTETHYEQRHFDHFSKSFVLQEDTEMVQGDSSKWLTSCEIPVKAPPSYHGKVVTFRWAARAGLDMAGNDPDSGWQEFYVAKKMYYTEHNL